MPDRWRGRAAGLAGGLLVAAAFSVGLTTGDGPTTGLRLLLTDADGGRLAAVELPADGRFTLRYRNSLYDSTAEERFRVSDGKLFLEELAADELAVLDEYHAALDTRPAPSGDPRGHVGRPALRVVLDELTVAATDRGRRTLLVHGGAALQLWHLVDDGDPSVTLRVEGAGG
jgi:hypothetical protein